MAMLMSTSDRAFRDCSSWIEPASVMRIIRQVGVTPKGWKIQRIAVARVFPAKSAGFGAQYGLTLTDGDQVIQGAVFVSSLSDHARTTGSVAPLTLDRRGALPLSGLLVPLEDYGMTLHTPDMDPLLPGVCEAISPALMAPRLKMKRPLQCRVLSYRPGRRCTIAYSEARSPRGAVVGKLYRHRRDARASSIQTRIRKTLESHDSALHVPRIVRRIPELNMTVSQRVPPAGRPASAEQRAAGASRVLAALHSMTAPPECAFTPADELRALDRWLDLCRRLHRFERAADEIRNWLERAAKRSIASRRTLIHRDFYDAQLLQTDSAWALVDFDTAASGDRELDIANYLAHLSWRSIRANEPSSAATAAATAFLSSYRSHAGHVQLCLDRLAFYLASSMLRVATIHSLRTGESAAARSLLTLANPSSWVSKVFLGASDLGAKS